MAAVDGNAVTNGGEETILPVPRSKTPYPPQKANYLRDRYRANPDAVWARNIKSKFGITPAQYEALLAAQGGRCAVCGASVGAAHQKRLHVDHDHRTGVIRGLLCGQCNNGIGRFGDNPELLRAAAAYLERRQI